MKLHKIYAETIDSMISTSLMKKLGMTLESVLRKHSQVDGSISGDLYRYAILESDYFDAHKQ